MAFRHVNCWVYLSSLKGLVSFCGGFGVWLSSLRWVANGSVMVFWVDVCLVLLSVVVVASGRAAVGGRCATGLELGFGFSRIGS